MPNSTNERNYKLNCAIEVSPLHCSVNILHLINHRINSKYQGFQYCSFQLPKFSQVMGKEVKRKELLPFQKLYKLQFIISRFCISNLNNDNLIQNKNIVLKSHFLTSSVYLTDQYILFCIFSKILYKLYFL